MTYAPVDQPARNKAAILARRWFEGTITNYELDDQWPWTSYDRGVVDIGTETWRYYDDFPEQTLTPQSLSKEELEVLQRCLRFLESREPYLDPETDASAASARRGMLSRLSEQRRTMTVVVSDERRRWWPFADEAQYSRGARE
jgi:hypothetical protein